MITLTLGVASLVVWIYLLVGRGFFWRGAECLAAVGSDDGRPREGEGPRVTAIVPARDEAEAVASLMRQDYPGPLTVVVVDDQSSDGPRVGTDV